MIMSIRQSPITSFPPMKTQCMRQNVISNPAIPLHDPGKVSSVVSRKKIHFSSTWYMVVGLNVEQERRKEAAVSIVPVDLAIGKVIPHSLNSVV